MMFFKSLVTSAVVALSFVYPGVVNAQTQQPSQEMIQQMQKVTVPDETMKEFIQAEQQIRNIRQDYSAKIQQGADEAKQKQLTDQANEGIRKIIEKVSISVDQYNVIAQALPHNQSLQLQYHKFIK
jgi:GTP1/Obg family GTP-binding protein